MSNPFVLLLFLVAWPLVAIPAAVLMGAIRNHVIDAMSWFINLIANPMAWLATKFVAAAKGVRSTIPSSAFSQCVGKPLLYLATAGLNSKAFFNGQ